MVSNNLRHNKLAKQIASKTRGTSHAVTRDKNEFYDEGDDDDDDNSALVAMVKKTTTLITSILLCEYKPL